MDYIDPQRAKFKELAREAALECYVKYNYLPASKEAAENWHPHVWVTDAMQKACASESERARTAELRADAAEAELAKIGGDYCKRTDELICANEKLADAEQRVAGLLELLKRIDRTPLDRWYRDGLNVAVFAALNPNPEAESHDRLDDEALQRRHDDERREYFRDDQ